MKRYTYDLILNPMLVPDLSGRLIHHDGVCGTCEGEWRPPYDPDTDDAEAYEDGEYDCTDCDQGKQRWGCWYASGEGQCEWCESKDVLVADMFDGQYEWICLPCYLNLHRDACGCGYWDWAVKLMPHLL